MIQRGFKWKDFTSQKRNHITVKNINKKHRLKQKTLLKIVNTIQKTSKKPHNYFIKLYTIQSISTKNLSFVILNQIDTVMSSCSNSFSPAFTIPQNYKFSKILQIEVFDVKSTNPGLWIANGRHCYCMITLQDYSLVRLEAGKNQSGEIQISYKLKWEKDYYQSRSLVRVNTKGRYIYFSDLGKWLQKSFKGIKYVLTDRNCYHVIKAILQYCGFQQQTYIIDKKVAIQNRKGLSSVTAASAAVTGAIIAGPIGFVVGGVIGKTYGWLAGKLFLEK